jgi:hypothetical protein
MAKSEVIATQIRELVESIFQEMLKVIAGHKTCSPGIDRQIESVWLDFQVELKDFFKQNHLTTAPLRAPYLQQSEAYFFQLKEDYLSASKQAYPIKIPSLIYDEINQRVDTTFQQLLQVISQHQGNLVEIDSQIEQIWASFQEELQQFLKDKKIATVALRAPYLQWAEDCLVKRKEAYENASEQAYLIKIPATVYHQITLQVRYIFQNIETVIEGQTESKPEIDDQIVRIWGNFSKGLDAFLKNKNFTTRTQRKPYIKHSEACFVACLEQYQKQEKEPYPIKLRPTTLFSDPPPRQLLSSEARLRLGAAAFSYCQRTEGLLA